LLNLTRRWRYKDRTKRLYVAEFTSDKDQLSGILNDRIRRKKTLEETKVVILNADKQQKSMSYMKRAQFGKGK